MAIAYLKMWGSELGVIIHFSFVLLNTIGIIGTSLVICVITTLNCNYFCFFFSYHRTVMFELLTGAWPYAGYPAEVLIYKVGNGFRQTLDKIEGHKQLKVYK